MTHIHRLALLFREKFPSAAQPRLFRAPGRVNLIGDHTDYNDGFVLPTAIDRHIAVAAAARDDHRVNVYSRNFDQWDHFNLRKKMAPQPGKSWSDYLRGMVWSLLARGYDLKGMDAVIDGDIPMGAGLSSSAAMEVALGFAMLNLTNAEFSLPELALMAQQAENDFVGMRCGIMDQFISCLGENNHALLIDCHDLTYRSVPIPPIAAIVIVESGVQRQLVDGRYNARRRECEKAADFFKVAKLRNVDPDTFRRRAHGLPRTVRHRARHVISENQRTLAAAKAFEDGDLIAVGNLMQTSHLSMRDDFEVSCPELDVLVEIAGAVQGVYGARLTGGGFGGCMVALVQQPATKALLTDIAKHYPPATGRQAAAYICRPSGGVTEINRQPT